MDVCWLCWLRWTKWIELKWGTTNPTSTLDWREKIKLFVVQWLCVMCLFTTVKLEQLGLRSRRTDYYTERKYATINHCIWTAIIALVLSLKQLSRIKKERKTHYVIMALSNMADTVFPAWNNIFVSWLRQLQLLLFYCIVLYILYAYLYKCHCHLYKMVVI